MAGYDLRAGGSGSEDPRSSYEQVMPVEFVIWRIEGKKTTR